MIHPDCLWIPSPNYGYPRGVLKQMEGAGEFWHSMVGSLAAVKNRFLNPAEEASAHFLYPREGIPTQMVDSGDAAWHSGNYLANLHFHGFEFEGGAYGNLSEPLTENQIEWGIKITRWLRDVHNTPKVYVRRETLWEHNEVQATSCPSGRIPWERLIQELEGDMAFTQADIDEIKRLAKGEAKFEVGQHRDHEKGFNEAQTDLIRQMIAGKVKEHADDDSKHGGGMGDHGHPHKHGEAG